MAGRKLRRIAEKDVQATKAPKGTASRDQKATSTRKVKKASRKDVREKTHQRRISTKKVTGILRKSNSSFSQTVVSSRKVKKACKNYFKNSVFKVVTEPQTEEKPEIELNPLLSFSHYVVSACMLGRKVSFGPFNFDPQPFNHASVSELIINRNFLDKLSTELLQLPFEKMSNDMYSFLQTDSLFDVKGNFPAVEDALDLISGPLLLWVEEITGKKLSKKVTATASIYNSCDRLLCHDDNLSDRAVAFILYLCKDWNDDDGGTLDLYECDSENQPRKIVKSIFPMYGSFVFFEVSKISYHQVAEVLSHKCRLSINGWYHGEELPEQIKWNEPLVKMCAPIDIKSCSLSHWVRPYWVQNEFVEKTRKGFKQNSYIALSDFLLPNIYEDLMQSLMLESIKWSLCGPANKRKYEVADATTLPVIWKDFLKLLKSKQWLKFLSKNFVDINLKPLSKAMLYYELQCWQAGDYTLLQDNDTFSRMMGIDVHLHFGVTKISKDQDGGEVFYLGPERNANGYLVNKEYVPTYNNLLYIQERRPGMASVTQYMDHKNKPFFKIFLHYSSSLS